MRYNRWSYSYGHVQAKIARFNGITGQDTETRKLVLNPEVFDRLNKIRVESVVLFSSFLITVTFYLVVVDNNVTVGLYRRSLICYWKIIIDDRVDRYISRLDTFVKHNIK